MEGLRTAAARLISGALEDLTLKGLTWRIFQILQDLLHRPATVVREADCALVPETKREALWLALLPLGAPEGRVRPGFALDETERALLDRHMSPGTPWPGIPLEAGSIRGAAFRNVPAVRELLIARPERWVAPLRLYAAALPLGFRDASPEGEHVFAEALVRIASGEDPRSPEQLDNVLRSGRDFLSGLIAYLRLFPLLPSVEAREVDDVVATAETLGLKRRERFDFLSAPDGGRQFWVTRYVSEAERSGLSLIPETRTPGEPDRLYLFPSGLFEEVLQTCGLGGEGDSNYAALSLIRAKRLESQIATIRPMLGGEDL
jgi:hypothetical protein